MILELIIFIKNLLIIKMLQTLQNKLVECEHPVGQKKTTNWNLPPKDFAYGKPPQSDKEGVGMSKTLITSSHQKLEEP
jgi:hypothetical protein